MEREPTQSSPWPVVAAAGIAATEVGVLFGLLPIAVAGVLAFGSSVAGMACEVGYAADRWRPLRLVGAAIAVVAAAAWLVVAPSPTPDGLVAAVQTNGIAVRAAIVLGSAALLVAVGAVGPVLAGSARGR